MVSLSSRVAGWAGSPALPATRLLFCADLHGNLGQFDAVVSHALAEGIRHVVFGGDLTPKDAARRTPALQWLRVEMRRFPDSEVGGRRSEFRGQSVRFASLSGTLRK